MGIIQRLIEGYKHFFDEYFTGDNTTYRELAERGQFPKALIIACSDSRADPSIITRAAPGDIFVIRNVANLVPPYQLDSAYHGTSAALEFAVNHLKVEHIIVLGHSRCAGIRALLDGQEGEEDNGSFIKPWVKIADAARKKVLAQNADKSRDEQAYCCEEEAIKISLKNLLTFPWIKEKVDGNTLAMHGWHFDVATGSLCAYDEKTNLFEPFPMKKVIKIAELG